jgi:hypothetical protein
MALDSFATFKTSIANWLDRTDLTTRIPDFITLAEVRIGRDLRVREMETRSQMSTVQDQGYYGLPQGFLQARSLKVITGSLDYDMEYRTPESMDLLNTNRFAGGTNIPRYYTVVADELRVLAKPAGIYTIEVVYYKKPDALSTTQTSNRVFENYPDVYLYATLLEAATYLRDIEGAQGWGLLYGKAIEASQTADDRDRHSGGALHVVGEQRGI